MPVFQLPDPRGEFVDKIAVVGHEDERPLVVLQRILKPFARVDVQVVRRLVEDEQVDLLIHQHTQPQTALFAAGKTRNGLEHVLALEQIRAQPVTRGLHGAVFFIEHRVQQRPFGVGEMNDLRQVGPLDRGAELHAARTGLLAEQEL